MTFSMNNRLMAAAFRQGLPAMVNTALGQAPETEHGMIEMAADIIDAATADVPETHLVEVNVSGSITANNRALNVSINTNDVSGTAAQPERAKASRAPWTPRGGGLGRSSTPATPSTGRGSGSGT
jgi:hypothetical protein